MNCPVNSSFGSDAALFEHKATAPANPPRLKAPTFGTYIHVGKKKRGVSQM